LHITFFSDNIEDMKRNIFTVFLLLFTVMVCKGQASFSTGEELFRRNKPDEALMYLENAIAEDPANVKAYLYLGIAYEQLDRLDEAIAVYRQIMANAGVLKANVLNNLGNVYFKKGSFSEAEKNYSDAIAADPSYSSAYLGKANALMQAPSLREGTSLQEALENYEQYLRLASRSPQRQQVERLTVYIRAEFAEAERRRLVAEENARAEAERRQRLLDEVSASLQAAAEASQGLSSGAEDIEGYEGEFELD